MSDIVPVTGRSAHPFYAWAAQNGARPKWNFHKILLDGQGEIVASIPTRVRPSSTRVTSQIEALLPSS